MFPLSKEDYIFLKEQKHDSFFYEPLIDTFYLVFWEGGIYNHYKNSVATFMNWRDDGLPYKHVIEYKIYTKVTINEVSGNAIISHVTEVAIEPMNSLEIHHLGQERQQSLYYSSTSLQLSMPHGLGYTHMITKRYPQDGYYIYHYFTNLTKHLLGCFINISKGKNLLFKTLTSGDQIFVDYNLKF